MNAGILKPKPLQLVHCEKTLLQPSFLHPQTTMFLNIFCFQTYCKSKDPQHMAACCTEKGHKKNKEQKCTTDGNKIHPQRGRQQFLYLSGLPRGTQSIHWQRQECSSPMELEVSACLLLQACCCKGSMPFTNFRWSHMCSLTFRKVKSGSRQRRAGRGASHHRLVMYHWKEKPKRVWGFRV